ncbi:MAG: hypothetical protein DMG68_08485, partial [Acidobacteria bacterium]
MRLPVYVRALGGIRSWGRRRLGYLDFKLNGQLLGGIAGGVVAGLILQLSTKHVFARNYIVQRTDHNREG